MQAPKIDDRTAHEIAQDVGTLLPVYVRQWPQERENGQLADALIHVFARFGELIVERLNKTPEKNFLAFLDLLGVSALPLQAARVPLTFSLAQGPVTHALVPAGTQVAAPPPKGQQDPIIFETERDLVVVAVKLDTLIVKDGGRGQITDFSSILTPPAIVPGGDASDATAPPATGDASVIPHVLGISIPTYPVWPPLSEVRLKFALDADLPATADARVLQWELCCVEPPKAAAGSATQKDDTAKAVAVAPLEESSASLTKSGDVVFFNLPEIPFTALGGYPGRWLLCRLLTPVTYATAPSAGMVRETQLPSVKALSIVMKAERSGLPLEQALFNSMKLDVTKDFLPFGNKPKFGDTFYFANREAFSNPDAVLTFRIVVTNPARNNVDTPIPAARPQDIKLSWEFWDGKAWTWLDAAQSSGTVRIQGEYADSTNALSDSGDLSFRFPSPPAPLSLAGQKNYWIRVRIVGGDYGQEAHYEPVKGGLIEKELSRGSFTVTPATFAPPSIHSFTVDYRVSKETQPTAVLTYNDFSYAMVNPQSGSFKPFLPAPPDQALPALYFGFTLPPAVPAAVPPKPPVFPNLALSVYVGLTAAVAGPAADPTPTIKAAGATWEYWNGADWTKTIILDDTRGLRRSGVFRFLAAPDFAPTQQFGQSRYWLRMRQIDPQFQPQLNHVLLNTTMAVQGATIAKEILGSSNETPKQVFHTTQKPVLQREKLEVRESTEPSFKERALIRAAAGEDAIVRVKEPTGKGDAFWVQWCEVPNFYGSGPRDRHYLLDRMTGEVTFGDGVNGLIPPALPANIRVTYRKGGGTAGNLPASAIAQLKSAVPYIQKASNCEAASGGTDSEPDAALLERGPRGIRHGGRAVTREDFEDLAMLASREVARARCVPLFDLTRDPDAKKTRPGVISLILAPRSADPQPRPSLDLFERVRSFLDARRQLTAQLKLVGPEYVRVDVECEIAAKSPEAAGEVETAARAALNSYLHPINGGDDGRGWDFGREPKRSDLYGLLEALAGVSHVRELRVSLAPDRPGSEQTGRFLICCGSLKITMTLKE